ncbi:MAG: DUF1573 domain-containing protein [Candidatus Yonathbacteria bacterium]|nr:DUF1573 domain-containing protein [Candidatus Yonathbacteria bacterium]
MKKNQLVILIIFAVAASFVILFEKRAELSRLWNESSILTEVTPSAGTLVATESFYDLGTISMSAGKVSRVFKITNSGGSPVQIKKIYTSCMCTTATLITREGSAGPFGMPGHAAIPTISEPIAPNEEASVEIVFDPAAHGPAATGKVRRIIYLETDAQKEPIELSFEATVTQ